MSNIAKLEALLFVAGDEGVTYDVLGNLLDQSKDEIQAEIRRYQAKLVQDKESCLAILESGNYVRLVTEAEYAPLIKKYAQEPLNTQLSQAVLETLAIIAYKQPITRVEIDQIRGVQSASAIQKLVLRQLIEDRGRLNAPGRPILYGTTEFFMDYFALKDLNELPDIESLLQASEEEESSPDLFFKQFQETLQETTSQELELDLDLKEEK